MKPKLKALAASLLLAATSGSAGAVIQTGDNGAPFLTVVSRGNVVSYTRDIGITMDSFLSGGAGLHANLSVDSVRDTKFNATAPDSNGTAPAGGGSRAITTVAPGTSAANIRGATPLTAGIQAAAEGRTGAVNALQSGAAEDSNFSPAGTNVLALNGDNAFSATLSGQASFNQRHTATTPLAANGNSGAGSPVVANQFRGRDDSAAPKFNLTPDLRLSASAAAPAPELNVPEPNNWAILLAGLLGAGAIARRRMSS